MSTAPNPKRKRASCPLCGQSPSEAHAPFCGQGCRDRDLLNWLDDGYRVPGPPADDHAADFAPDGLDSEC